MVTYEFNRTDALAVIAASAKNAESGQFNLMARAGVYIWSADKVKVAEGEMLEAFCDAGLTEGSAQNYISKARAVAKHLDALKLPPDDGEAFSDYADRIAPDLQQFWGSIRNIRMAGPNANKGAARAKGKKTAPDATIPSTALTNPSDPQHADAVEALMAMLETFVPVATLDQLNTIADRALSEIVRRDVVAKETADVANQHQEMKIAA